MPEDSRLPPSRNGDIRIREAVRSDIDDLLRLEEAAFASDRLSRRRLAAFVKSPSASLLVGRCGDELAGYSLVLTRTGSRAARLYSLAVSPDFAGRGLGTRLLAAAEAAAHARGAESLRLEVRGDNLSAIRLYERRGYDRIGSRSEYYADGMGAIRLARMLGPGTAVLSSPQLGQAA